MKQLLLPPGIPWYRTRLFWGVIYLLIIVLSVTDFYLWILTTSGISSLSLWQLTIHTIFSSGAALFFLLGTSFGKLGALLFSVLFYAIIIFCIYKTFQRKRVTILYPTIVIVMFVSGILLAYSYASGL